MSTTITAALTANSGSIESYNTTYATAVTGSNLSLSAHAIDIGQSYVAGNSTYFLYNAFLEFDLSSVPSAATVTSISLHIYDTSDPSASDADAFYFIPYNWGDTLTTSNWMTATDVGAANTYEAARVTTGNLSEGQNSVSMQTGVMSYVSNGKLRLLGISENYQNGTAPTKDGVQSFDGYSIPNVAYLSVTYTMPAPTITSISPTVDQLAGGDTATIVGTGFQDNDPGTVSVTICGLSATNVTVQSDTQLACTIPVSGAAQVGNVVVSTANNGSGTLANAFTYVNTTDTHVYLVKGGVISGTDHASSTIWPLGATAQTYGGSADMWGLSLAPSDTNANNFGVAIAADVGAGHGNIQDVQMTVYFTTTGTSLPGTYLAALSVDSTGDTVTPTIYKLPYSGFPVALDQSIPHATSGADFYTSRLYLPNRNVLKSWRCVEFYCDLTPEINTPGLQVWASVDDGAFTQLNDGSGNPATIYTSGAQRLFFAEGASGHYVQLDIKIPALGSGQVPVAAMVRDLMLRTSLRPVATDTVTATLILGQGQFPGRTTMRDTAISQREFLENLFVPGGTVSYRDPVTGEMGQMLFAGLQFQEMVFPGKSESTLVAHITLRQTEFD